MSNSVEKVMRLIETSPELQGSENAELREALLTKALDQRNKDKELELAGRQQKLEERNFWHNTPLVVALTGVIAVGANFVADYFRAEQDLSGLLTKSELDATLASNAENEALLRDREREVLSSELELKLAEAAAVRTERLKEIEFQYSILSQLVDEPNESTRARLLLFYIRAGALQGLNVDELRAMAETSIRNTGGDPGAPMGVPSRESISKAEDATVRIQFSGSSGQTGYCTAVSISANFILAPSICDNNYLGGSHPFSAAMSESNAFVRLKRVWQDDAAALSVLERETKNQEPVSLDWQSIRSPSVGEAIYFVTWDVGSEEKTSRICSVVGINADQGSLSHDCRTGPGIAGALLIALSDDAPIGVHLGQNETGGYGSSLGSLRDQLAQFF